MPEPTLRVGELARRTGLTVRTLHHYDDIGLLVPAERSDAGHRHYTDADLARLQQITALRSVGLSLDVVRSVLDGETDPVHAIERQLAHLRETLALQQQLTARLESLAARYRTGPPVTADDLIHTIQLTTMLEKHNTPEQLDTLKQRARARPDLGDRRAFRRPHSGRDFAGRVRVAEEVLTETPWGGGSSYEDSLACGA